MNSFQILLYFRIFVMTTDHLFMDTTNSNIRFISTSSSSGDKGNVASNGEDISLNSLVKMYDRFKDLLSDMEISSVFVILMYFLHPIYFSTLHHFQKNINDNNKILNIHDVSSKAERKKERKKERVRRKRIFDIVSPLMLFSEG